MVRVWLSGVEGKGRCVVEGRKRSELVAGGYACRRPKGVLYKKKPPLTNSETKEQKSMAQLIDEMGERKELISRWPSFGPPLPVQMDLLLIQER